MWYCHFKIRLIDTPLLLSLYLSLRLTNSYGKLYHIIIIHIMYDMCKPYLCLGQMRPSDGPQRVGRRKPYRPVARGKTFRNHHHAMLWSYAPGHSMGSLHDLWPHDRNKPYVYSSVKVKVRAPYGPLQIPYGLGKTRNVRSVLRTPYGPVPIR